jgi:hypothetical protein
VSEQPEEYWQRRANELLDQIPGYRGYRLKDERRDADRRVREAVASAYASELARVEQIGRTLANARRLEEIGDVERVSQAIRHYIDRVRTASSGYGGIFGDRDVDGVALDQLRLFDEGLMLGADELEPSVSRLEAAAAAGLPLRPAADEAARLMEQQIARLNARQEVIETGHASKRDSVLAMLKPAAAPPPPDLYSAGTGDAVSILGDDHTIDARIVVDGQPQSFRVFRIQREPEEWLFVSNEAGSPIIRLNPVEPPRHGADIAGSSLKPTTAGTGDGELIGVGNSSGLRPVRYALLSNPDQSGEFGLILDWDGERQAFVGQRVEPLDVEIYRRSQATG